MSLSIGIVGLPNVGKSTLFQAITKKQIDRQNYPFCTIDPNIGVVAVPDERVDKLAELTSSAKKIYTTIKFVDIAGLVEGANKGEGLGNKFLANIRETDAIVYVLRCFKNDKIINTQPKIDPLNEKGILDTEMELKDLESDAEQLLMDKPRLFLLNGKKEEIDQSIIDEFEKNNWKYLILDILSEFDSASLSVEERKEFELPIELKLDELIKKSYDLLDLITFLTTGPDETRAWTLKKGSLAPRAGGVIHTDFEKNFVKAEVVNWQKLLESGGLTKAREQGLIRTEGKEYIVQDGDVIEIKANA